MKIFKFIYSILLLTFISFTYSCSNNDDNDLDENNGETTILFDMLYSGTYTTSLKDGYGRPYPEDKIYRIILKPSKKGSITGELSLKGHTIPIVVREYKSSKYPDDKFFEIIITDYNGKGNNANVVYRITTSSSFFYQGFNASNDYILMTIVSPLIGESFGLLYE